MQPQCPSGTSLLTSTFLCGFPCDAGTGVFNQDDLYCVGTTCPLQTTKDPNDNSVCIKASTALQGFGCPPGSTEWIPNRCFVDCPSLFRENAQTCLIPLIRRQTAVPACPSFYFLSGQQCVRSTAFIWALSISALLIIVLAVLYTKYKMPRDKNKIEYEYYINKLKET